MNKFSDLSHSAAEVLDLTHDHALPFRLQFDDHSWRQHLNSLKPLGLAILLNTCNMDTQEHYMQFCCHVTCEALYNEDLVPVTNRRYVSMSLESRFRLCLLSHCISSPRLCAIVELILPNVKLITSSFIIHIIPRTVQCKW